MSQFIPLPPRHKSVDPFPPPTRSVAIKNKKVSKKCRSKKGEVVGVREGRGEECMLWKDRTYQSFREGGRSRLFWIGKLSSYATVRVKSIRMPTYMANIECSIHPVIQVSKTLNKQG